MAIVGDGKYHLSDKQIIREMVEYCKMIIQTTTDEKARNYAIQAVELTGPNP